MPGTLKLSQDVAATDLLVVVLISSRHVTGLVAGMGRTIGNRTLAHKRVDAVWDELEEVRQIEVVADVVRRVCDAAGVIPRSVYLSRSEVSLSSRLVAGETDFGGSLQDISEHEMQWALRRAQEKPVGTEQELIDVIPVRWELHGEITRTTWAETPAERREAKHHFPLGEQARGLTCHALQVIARRGYRAELDALAKGIGLTLEGVIAQPAALYRGIARDLPERGWSLIIDCGARHTSFLLRSGERLLRLRTFDFGGDHLTHVVEERLGLPHAKAEALKRTLNIALPAGADATGQQTIWSGTEAVQDVLAPEAARICRGIVCDFFEARAHELQDDPDNPLPRKGTIHLVGRASQLGGLVPLLSDIFGLTVVLGSGKGNRDIGEELDNLLLSGLVVSAIDQRRAAMELAGTSLSGKASGVWAWLTRSFE